MAKAGTIGNPKTLDLADMLNCEPWGALGLVEAFWDWAAEYATDGALRGIKPAVIADGVKWKGKPAKLLQLLLDSGWLDDSGYSEIGLVIHDWHHHAQDRVRKKLIRSGKTFWDGADPRTKPDERDRQMTTKERIDAYGETRAEHRDTAHEIATPCRDDTDPERTPRRDGIATAFPENGTGVALRTRVSPSHPIQTKKQEVCTDQASRSEPRLALPPASLSGPPLVAGNLALSDGASRLLAAALDPGALLATNGVTFGASPPVTNEIAEARKTRLRRFGIAEIAARRLAGSDAISAEAEVTQ